MTALSLNANELIRIIKASAVDAVNSGKPFSFVYGRVLSINPLRVYVDQKMTLTSKQLLLTNAVRDYTVYMTTAGENDTDDTGATHYTGYEEQIDGSPNPGQFTSHRHEYKGKKKWTVHMKLKIGEKIIMLRCDGGQKYIILDRVEAPDE